MSTRQTITISLPTEMLEAVDKVMKAEHRTRSELVREALRAYMTSMRFPVVSASPGELRAIRRGRAEHKKGDYLTLDELLHDMGSTRRPVRRKRA
ncbi:MAG: ribbon-helix-helix protein, CopG family [Acidobacteriota bacterium]